MDTSSLLKLVILDDHTLALVEALQKEESIVASALTQLEFSVQLRGLMLGGSLRPKSMQQAGERLSRMLQMSPYISRSLSGTVFSTALGQHESAKIQCRSLDRIHLAAMAEFGITRLMTHDLRQATAAKELGYEVLSPGL
ncbi:PIN domain-containing protein [Luteolibacter sp. Populi]|uniref:PIN domain-containing protein n=1 Tax=Luteolibacter sp. Populi TaxID=3230487 RepID=UPI0034664DFF